MEERSRIFEARWLAVLSALAVYESVYLVGGFFESTALNSVGVAAFLLVLLFGLPGARPDPRLKTLKFAAVPLLALLLASLVHPANTPLYHLSKFALFYILILVFSSTLPYGVEDSCYLNFWRFLVICPLAASLLLGRSQDVFGDVRTAGLFVNANSFALMAFLLPAVLPAHASRGQRVVADVAALAIIVMSGTSGALLSYALAALLTRLRARSWLVLFASLTVIAVVAIIYREEIISALMEHKATERIALQLQAVSDGINNVQTGIVDYGMLSREYGSSALSGLWRLVHWLTIWDRYLDGGPSVLVFGFGPGSAHLHFAKLPHNDFLRVLYEQGIAGLAAFVYFYGRVLGTISRQYRYLILGFLLYCITENNLDNFLFMSMFAVIIATHTRRERECSTTPPTQGI